MNSQFYDGSGQPAPERTRLQAGALTMEYEAGMLRYIRLGDTEIVRGIYAAVRDHNWTTIPGVLRDVELDAREESFAITFTSDHVFNDIHFAWRGTITGSEDSTITFTFYGQALTTFQRNRVGFCILHPMEVAGQALDIEHSGGVIERGEFPRFIAPHQPYLDIHALTHEVISGLSAEVRMAGDTFEMEDQRNWTDASYKTYCTPLAQPYPVTLEAGTMIRQSVTVRLIGEAVRADVRETPLTLYIDPSVSQPLPTIGLYAASHGEPLTERETSRFRALNLSHVRLGVVLNDDWQPRLEQVWREAQGVLSNPLLELAIHTSADAEAELTRLRRTMQSLGVTGHLLVFHQTERVTSRAIFETTVRVFDGFPHPLIIGAGTDDYFTQLNRQRPPIGLADWIAYSVNPQVHAFDKATLVEALEGMTATVQTARTFAPGAKIAVTPITFKGRSNPDATAPEAPTPSGQLPASVDPRQMSLFGAGWTMGAIASLSWAGADGLTFYEMTGWLGVMERENGSPLPELFPSIPSGVFPMYHVFADVGEFAGGDVLGVIGSAPLRFGGLALRKANRMRLIMANFTHEPQTLTIAGINGAFEMKSLDETTVEAAMRDPEGYRAASGAMVTAGDEGLRVELLPYAVVRLDQESNVS